MNTHDPYAKLGGGALDQELFKNKPTPPPPTEEKQDSPQAGTSKKKATEKKGNAGLPASQSSRMLENQHASKLASQRSGNTELQHAGKTKVSDTITATEKVTYRFHPEGKYAVEDMKTILVRKYGIKASLEEIAEEAILLAYEDLLENQHASKLANRLSRMLENKKSS
jgi:hypothetical protein